MVVQGINRNHNVDFVPSYWTTSIRYLRNNTSIFRQLAFCLIVSFYLRSKSLLALYLACFKTPKIVGSMANLFYLSFDVVAYRRDNFLKIIRLFGNDYVLILITTIPLNK